MRLVDNVVVLPDLDAEQPRAVVSPLDDDDPAK